MWKDSIRNIVVIFQTTILRIVGFYVRRSAKVVTFLKRIKCHGDLGARLANDGSIWLVVDRF
jgi:hypothetical protein